MMAIDHYGYSHKIIDNETHFLQYYKENGHNVDVIVVDTVGFHRMDKRLIGKQGLSKVIFKDFWGIYRPNEDGIYTSLLEASQFWTAYPVPPNTFLGFTVEDTCSRKVGRTQGFGIVWGKMPSYITYGEHVWKTIFKHFPLISLMKDEKYIKVPSFLDNRGTQTRKKWLEYLSNASFLLGLKKPYDGEPIFQNNPSLSSLTNLH